jgi:hypothetical protein
MTEPLKRRNLLAVPAFSDALPQETIAAVAACNGFPAAAPPAAGGPQQADSGIRRRYHQPTGRHHQFNVRLRRDTLDFIYAQANERNIPVAQVIEEATEALRRAQINRS